MTWTKTSDDYEDDCWGLSDAAYRLHHEGHTWSNRKLLDCRIPREDLRRFKRPEALPELLERGFWEEDGDDLVIVHHAAYQRTAEQVIKMQDSRRANGAKGGRPAGPAREIWKEPRRKPSSEPSSKPPKAAKPKPESYGKASSEPRGTGQGQDRALEVRGPVPEQRASDVPDPWASSPPGAVDLRTGEVLELEDLPLGVCTWCAPDRPCVCPDGPVVSSFRPNDPT